MQIKNILGPGSSNTENYNNNDFFSYLQNKELTHTYFNIDTLIILHLSGTKRCVYRAEKRAVHARQTILNIQFMHGRQYKHQEQFSPLTIKYFLRKIRAF